MEEKKKTVFADLGQKGYREVWELQERLLEKVKAEKAGNKIPENHLLFVEHDRSFEETVATKTIKL